ncbi:MAG: hypothetical protein ABI222_18130 [Opitutaceae bacterium]
MPRRVLTNPMVSPPARAAREDRLRVDPKWAWHYRRLRALRDRLMQPARVCKGVNAAGRDYAEFTMARLKSEPEALAGIAAAIERILHGTYGICEISGRKIPAHLLRKTPWGCSLPVRLGEGIRMQFP